MINSLGYVYAVGDLSYTIKSVSLNEPDPVSEEGMLVSSSRLQGRYDAIVKQYGKTILAKIDSNVDQLAKLPNEQEVSRLVSEIVFLIDMFSGAVSPRFAQAAQGESLRYFDDILRAENSKFKKSIEMDQKTYDNIKLISQWDETFFSRHFQEVSAWFQAQFAPGKAYSRYAKGRIEKADDDPAFFGIVGRVNDNEYRSVMADQSSGFTRSYGSGTVWETHGVTIIKVIAVIDHRTTEMCKQMHGTTFEIQEVLEHYEQVLHKTSPEAFLRGNSWLSHNAKDGVHIARGAERIPVTAGMSSSSVLKSGVALPPYHAGCRTGTEVDFTSSTTQIGGNGSMDTDSSPTARKPNRKIDPLLAATTAAALAVSGTDRKPGESDIKPTRPSGVILEADLTDGEE